MSNVASCYYYARGTTLVTQPLRLATQRTSVVFPQGQATQSSLSARY